VDYAAEEGCGKGIPPRTHTKGVVLLTAKKRVDIVQSSEKLEQLKSFYRAIVGDERNTAVLKPAGK
jgi:hypothetical protein